MKKISFFFLPLVYLLACTEAKKESPKTTQDENQKIIQLQLKLQATENQLLDCRNELAKYKGDSLSDSNEVKDETNM